MRFALALLAWCLGAPLAHAERYVLQFEGSAYGVLPLGRSVIDIHVADGGYVALATVRSGGLAALFDDTSIDARSDGALEEGVARFTRYQLDHHYARKRRQIDMRPAEAGVFAAITPPLGDPIEIRPTPAQTRGARDPLSSLVAMAAQVAATGSCAGRFPTFDGRFRYDLHLRVEGSDRHAGGGYDGPVQKCKVRFQPIAGYRTARDMERRIPEGEIWFAMLPGAAIAPPVRVTAPLPLGRAGVKLRRFMRPMVMVEAAEAPEQGGDQSR